MYVGVRAGGGIGDEIEDPAGDEYELYRVVFDITFFFFVIIILLAIIQGQCWLRWWVGVETHSSMAKSAALLLSTVKLWASGPSFSSCKMGVLMLHNLIGLHED